MWIPASKVSYDTRVASWRKLLQNCMKAHDDCRNNESFTPTRLLEITNLHDAEYNVRLLCCQNFSVIGSYTTLSYRWGTGANGPCRTTKDNFNEHMRGIAWDKLTKTIQDAICVTHALGLKLLWVDSLCIIQDDQSDWENEAAKISDVFAGSELTIAAVAASDSCGGLEIGYIAPPIYDPPGNGIVVLWYDGGCLVLETWKRHTSTQEAGYFKRFYCLAEDFILPRTTFSGIVDAWCSLRTAITSAMKKRCYQVK